MNLIRQIFSRKISREEQFKNKAEYGSSVSFGWAGNVTNFSNNPQAIKIGENCLINGDLVINPYGGKIEIGDFCYIGHNSRIQSDTLVAIGNDVQISYNVNIVDNNAHEINSTERVKTARKILLHGYENLSERGNIAGKEVFIEDKVWINFNCIVLKGVRIGEGAVIGAGSVVTKDIPAFTFAAGNPARVIKNIN
jgi:acetyltransferase-like isoleucine patch superfamily enzyme